VTLFRLGLFADVLTRSGIPVFCLDGRSLYDLRIGSSLRQYYSENQPDIVHSLFWDANVWTAWALRKEKNLRLITSRRELGTWRKRRHLWAERWTNRQAAGVVTNSEATRRFVCREEGLSPEKVRVIYNAVQVEAFRSISRQEGRRLLGLDERALVLGVVASLAPKKGHEDLFRALASVQNQLSGWVLLVAGAGGEQERLSSLAADMGFSANIRFLGVRSDIPAILASLDMLVHPSHTESMPNAVLEAMASGLPVVATSAGGTPEAIENGKTGLLVPPGSPDSLARAVLRLAGDAGLRYELGMSALEKVRHSFTPEQAADAYLSLFDSLLGNTSSPVH
jgi:glycosyltransferase involved in cell wall biosynthesis